MEPLQAIACVWLPEPQSAARHDELLRLLLTFSPKVEPEREHAGLYYVDPNGLNAFYDSFLCWAHALCSQLETHSYRAGVAVGTRRWSAWALACAGVHARQTNPQVVIDTQQQLAYDVPLKWLPVPPAALLIAHKLRLRTLGDVLPLAASQVQERLGPALAGWHAAMHRTCVLPLSPKLPQSLCCGTVAIDPPDTSVHRLLFAIKQLMPGLVAEAKTRCQHIAAVHIVLVLQKPGRLTPQPPAQCLRRRLELATPTHNEMIIVDLVRLYLSSLTLPAAVAEVMVEAELQATQGHQLAFWAQAQRRNVGRANQTLAQLRAALGEHAVVVATLASAHLPEQAFAWQPVRQLRLPNKSMAKVARATGLHVCQQLKQTKQTGFAGGLAPLPLVRRMFAVPKPLTEAKLPSRSFNRVRQQIYAQHPAANTDAIYGSHLAGYGPVAQAVQGPYFISTGWWAAPCDRDYYYVRAPDKAWLLISFDRQLRRWLWHGMVD